MCILCHYPGRKGTAIFWVLQRILAFLAHILGHAFELPVWLWAVRSAISFYVCYYEQGNFQLWALLYAWSSSSTRIGIVHCLLLSIICFTTCLLVVCFQYISYWYFFDDWWQRPYAADIDMYLPWDRVVAVPLLFVAIIWSSALRLIHFSGGHPVFRFTLDIAQIGIAIHGAFYTSYRWMFAQPVSWPFSLCLTSHVSFLWGTFWFFLCKVSASPCTVSTGLKSARRSQVLFSPDFYTKFQKAFRIFFFTPGSG